MKGPGISERRDENVQNAIEVREVWKRYKKRWIIRDISFDVKKGEIFALLGPSGSGKSTLLRVLAGMESPTEGSVQFLNRKGRKIHEILGIVPQSEGVYEELTVWENLEYFGKLYKLPIADIRRKGTNLLKQLFIHEAKDQEVRDLSGGMRRRLNICCALIHDPQIVLMDEPTTGLDPVTRMALWRTIRDINNLGKTIIFTTHLMEETIVLANRLALIREGTVEISGNARALITGMGMPVRIESDPGNPEALLEAVRKVRGVKDAASRFGQTLVIPKGTDSEALIPHLKNALAKIEEQVLSIGRISPDMNDVFFYYTEKRREAT